MFRKNDHKITIVHVTNENLSFYLVILRMSVVQVGITTGISLQINFLSSVITLNPWWFSTIRLESTLWAFFSCLQPHAVALELNLYASGFTILLMRFLEGSV